MALFIGNGLITLEAITPLHGSNSKVSIKVYAKVTIVLWVCGIQTKCYFYMYALMIKG